MGFLTRVSVDGEPIKSTRRLIIDREENLFKKRATVIAFITELFIIIIALREAVINTNTNTNTNFTVIYAVKNKKKFILVFKPYNTAIIIIEFS